MLAAFIPFVFLPLKHSANKHSFWICFHLWPVFSEKFWIFYHQGKPEPELQVWGRTGGGVGGEWGWGCCQVDKEGGRKEAAIRKESPRRKAVCKTNFRNQQSASCSSPPHRSFHTWTTIFSSRFDQLLRLQNVPLKHQAASGENDFQPTQRPPRLKELSSGVGCPNRLHHCLADSLGWAFMKHLASGFPEDIYLGGLCCTEESVPRVFLHWAFWI